MKLKLSIATIMLYLILTGLYLYHSILLNSVNFAQSSLDLNEFKSVDLSLNAEFYKLKNDIFADQKTLNIEWENFTTKKDIIVSILKQSPETISILKNFETYTASKKTIRESILKSIKILQLNLLDLNTQVDNLAKLNIKFTVDRKDFYKELVINTYLFALSPNPNNTLRTFEDRKILHQILTYSTITNPNILRLKEIHDVIIESTQNIEVNLKLIENNSFEKEISQMSAEFQKAQKIQDDLKDKFLLVTIITFTLYLVVLFFILRKI